MAQNYISRGEVISLTADRSHESGRPYRLHGFNGVALLSVSSGETLSFQLEGVFELELAGVEIGDVILIDEDNKLIRLIDDPGSGSAPFGRAISSTDADGKFYCRLIQSLA